MTTVMQLVARETLLQSARLPRAYGRHVIVGKAIEELAWRCFERHVTQGCSRLRCARVESVIAGRKAQLGPLAEGFSRVEIDFCFRDIYAGFVELQSRVAAAAAAAAFEEVLNGL